MKQADKQICRTCAGVLILALLLRLAGSTPVLGKLPENPDTAAFLLYLATGRAGSRVPDRQEPETVPAEEAPAAEAPALHFPPELAEDLAIKYGTEARPDLGQLLAAAVDLDFSGTEPRILIVHTHATESYTQEPGWEYAPSGAYRSLDGDYNMLRVGQQLARRLNVAGIPTVQARELNDYPSYNDSYSRTLELIESYLETYPTIQMVIDVHRDAVEYDDGSQMGTYTEIGGESSAQILLVMGSDEGGLYHPDWEQNLSWALKLQVRAEQLYPGLTRPLSLRPERYNEHATPGSILLEVGTAGDTLSDALRAADAFADVLIDIIDGLGLRENFSQSPKTD